MTDMRTLWFKGEDETEWRPVALATIDAAHALEVDADHWKAEKPTEDDPVVDIVEDQNPDAPESTSDESTS